MTGIELRPATEADAEGIRNVARAAWHAAYSSMLEGDRIDRTVESWYAPERLIEDDIAPDERPLFVAVADGTVVGFAEAPPDGDDTGLAHLYRIYVDPDHWGQGIGRALLERIQMTLRERNFERLTVSVHADNEVGVAFYEAAGFERLGTAPDEAFGGERHEYRKRL